MKNAGMPSVMVVLEGTGEGGGGAGHVDGLSVYNWCCGFVANPCSNFLFAVYEHFYDALLRF